VVDSLTGTITRTPDILDRLQQEVTAQGSVSYGYDNANRRTSMTVLGQAQVTYGYDNADRLTSLAQGTASVTIGYDDANRRTTLTLPNTVQATYGYDTSNRLTSITFKKGAATLGTLTYTYDAAGRRTVMSGTWARTGLPTAVASASYNANNQQTAWGGQTNTFDLNGNLISDGTNTYTWDARNRLAGISGAIAASFQYDPTGRRISKTISGTTTQFLYDGANPVQELSGAGGAGQPPDRTRHRRVLHAHRRLRAPHPPGRRLGVDALLGGRRRDSPDLLHLRTLRGCDRHGPKQCQSVPIHGSGER
jgi:YD repeat-containing protein